MMAHRESLPAATHLIQMIIIRLLCGDLTTSSSFELPLCHYGVASIDGGGELMINH